jgi:alanyl-tRNA synthetase
VHKVKDPDFAAGHNVDCKVDSKRRIQIVKHHTATHLINGAARQILGYHVWQAGSKKDADKAHLDITHYDTLSDAQLREMEKIVNNVIAESLKVRKEVLPRAEAEKKYGFILYQGGVVPETMLRIISVTDFDAEACGGLHTDNTSEVEEVFIFNSRRMQDGVIRLEYVAGKELVEKTRKDLEARSMTQEERYRKKMEGIENEKQREKSLKQSAKKMLGINYVDSGDMKELEIIATESVKNEPEKFSVLIGNGVVYGIKGDKCSEDIEKIVTEAVRMMNGRAGGKQNRFMGGGQIKDNGKEVFEKLKKFVLIS